MRVVLLTFKRSRATTPLQASGRYDWRIQAWLSVALFSGWYLVIPQMPLRPFLILLSSILTRYLTTAVKGCIPPSQLSLVRIQSNDI